MDLSQLARTPYGTWLRLHSTCTIKSFFQAIRRLSSRNCSSRLIGLFNGCSTCFVARLRITRFLGCHYLDQLPSRHQRRYRTHRERKGRRSLGLFNWEKGLSLVFALLAITPRDPKPSSCTIRLSNKDGEAEKETFSSRHSPLLKAIWSGGLSELMVWGWAY